MNTGKISLSTLIKGNGGFIDTSGVDEAVLHATDDEKKQYTRGLQLTQLQKQDPNNAALTNPSDTDKQALDFYNSVQNAFNKAQKAGSVDPQKMIWESKLLYGGDDNLLTQIAHSINVGGGPTAENINEADLFSSLDKMSATDWNRLHDNPVYQKEVEDALTRALKGKSDDLQEALDLLHRKETAGSATDADNVHEDLFAHPAVGGNGQTEGMLARLQHADAYNLNYDPVSVINAIVHMSPEDLQSYKQNPDALKKQISGYLSGNDKDNPVTSDNVKFAQQLLDKLQNSQDPNLNLLDDPYTKIKLDLLLVQGGSDMPNNPERPDLSAQAVKDIQDLFQKNPDLLAQFQKDNKNDPQYQQLRNLFDRAISQAVQLNGVDGKASDLEKAIYSTGRVPLQWELKLDKNASVQDKLKDILENSSPEERARLLLITPSKDDQKFQDTVFGALGGNKDNWKALIQNALTQQQEGVVIDPLTPIASAPGNGLDKVDELRAFMLGDGSSFDDVEAIIKSIPPDQLNIYKTEYNSKYHGDLDQDLLSHFRG
ncbi:MAG: hypothetical protein ACRD3W_15040, partial [Terriglobales bacterium]